MKFVNNNENCVEFLNNQKTMTVSFCSQKWITKIKKLSQSNPDDVEIIAENKDGSICARLSIKLNSERKQIKNSLDTEFTP